MTEEKKVKSVKIKHDVKESFLLEVCVARQQRLLHKPRAAAIALVDAIAEALKCKEKMEIKG